MDIGRVVGHAVSSVKPGSLEGMRLVLVETAPGAREIVADVLQAGYGDEVLLTRGTSARLAVGDPDCPIDVAILAILDAVEDRAPAEGGAA
jgi:ethanolamine utilization protein EutN